MDEKEALHIAIMHYKSESANGAVYARPVYKALMRVEQRLTEAEEKNKRFNDWVDFINKGKGR